LYLDFSENFYVSLCCKEVRTLSLRKKTLLIITITLAGLIILLYASSRSILLQSFVLLENDDVYLNTERGLQAMTNEVAALTATAQAWATRRDSAAFVQGADATYIETYLDDSTFIANHLNIVAFVDASGKLVYEQNFDLITDQKKNVATGIAQYLQSGSPLLNLTGDSTTGGVLLLPAGPALVTAVPIAPDKQSPAVGVLILGRYLNQSEMQRMADAAQLLLSIYYFEEPRLPPDVMAARAHLSEQKRFFIRTIDEHNIIG
jgi:sensor domain CHASE-containing protein